MDIDKNVKDDDLIIELEEFDDSIPQPQEEVAAEARTIPEPENLPDVDADADDEGFQPDPRGRQQTTESEDDEAAAAPESDPRFEERERRILEREAVTMWERAQDQAELAQSKRAMADVSLQFCNDKIEAAYTALEMAKEAGDSRGEINAQKAIDELKTLRANIEAARASYPDPDRILAEGRQKAIKHAEQPIERPSVEVGANIRARNPVAANWAKQNASWMQSNARANEFVIRTSKAMAESGQWDVNGPGFYAELGKRVAKNFPGVKVANLQAPKGSAPQRRTTPVVASKPSNGVGTQQPANRSNARKYTLTADEQRKMRAFNLDPKNKEHALSWARTRIASQRRSAENSA